ncbi:MAG: flagellar assembly protein FliX [Alphaproteobacteria bacterium]
MKVNKRTDLNRAGKSSGAARGAASARPNLGAESSAFEALINAAPKHSGNDALGAMPGLAGGASGAHAVDSIIAIQALDNETEGGGNSESYHASEEQRALKEHAGRLLDAMRWLQLGLLNGTITAADLESLKTHLDYEKSNGNYPQLVKLVEDIELRAHIELAKLQHATHQDPNQDLAMKKDDVADA